MYYKTNDVYVRFGVIFMRKQKIISILMAIGLSISLFACSQAKTSNETESQNVTSESDDSEKNQLSDEECIDIVKNYYNKTVEYARNNDLNSFKSLYLSDINDDVINKNFQTFSSDEQFESEDYTINFKDKDVIGCSVFLYTNLKDTNGNTQNKKRNFDFNLIKEAGEWKISNNDKIIRCYKEQYEPKLIEIFGDDYYKNGYCNNSYQVINNKVLLNNVSVEVQRFKVNSDNTVNLSLAIENGLDNDIYGISFCDNSTIYDGNNVAICCIDNLQIDSMKICEAKKILLIDLTLDRSNLYIDPSQINTTSMGINNRITYQNRQK